MNKLIFRVIALSLVSLGFLTSCDNEDSLQQYYVDHSESEGFISTSIPKTIAGIDADKLSEESAKAYNSIDKISILALPLTDKNKTTYTTETEKLDKIFKNEKYELLMSHNSDGMKMKMMFDGSQGAIDEIIVYGNSPEMGLGVARILGDDMNMGSILNMMKELESQNINPTGIQSMMKGMGMPMGKEKMNAE
jgi:hypothetical protein